MRRCLNCDRPLPTRSRRTRKFCSTPCRVRHWDANNRPEASAGEKPPLHYHIHADGWSALTGFATAGYWRGPAGCPPQCPGLDAPGMGGPYASSQPVPEGREGLGPQGAR